MVGRHSENFRAQKSLQRKGGGLEAMGELLLGFFGTGREDRVPFE